MPKDHTILVGTVGQGMSRTMDGGNTWDRTMTPFAGGSKMRALTVYPDNPHRVLAGTDRGVYRSEDTGNTWKRLTSDMDDTEIFCLAIDPVDTNIIYAGTTAGYERFHGLTAPGVYRSKDDGLSWGRLDLDIGAECVIGLARVLALAVDPRDHRKVWAGVEIGGVFQSLDSGDTWAKRPPMGPDSNHEDIHWIGFAVGEPTKIMVACPMGVFSSTDEGKSWTLKSFAPSVYTRGLNIVEAEPNTIFVANGNNGPNDRCGVINRSKDRGETWAPVTLPEDPNSQMDWIVTHPEVPGVVVACTLLGHVFASNDGGDTWRKFWKEFSEIRSLALMPN